MDGSFSKTELFFDIDTSVAEILFEMQFALFWKTNLDIIITLHTLSCYD